MTKIRVTSGIHTYRKKMPRGWLTHIFSYYDYLSHEEETFVWWLLISYIPSLFRSSLKASPECLELLLWPAKPQTFSWDEITHLEHKKVLGLVAYDRLFLDRPRHENRIVIALTTKSREWVDAQKIYIILSDFQGWPNGKLADDLYRYAPQIFEQANPITK